MQNDVDANSTVSDMITYKELWLTQALWPVRLSLYQTVVISPNKELEVDQTQPVNRHVLNISLKIMMQ